MNELLTVRLNQEQLNRLTAEAERLNISKGELIRLLINSITL